MDYASPIGYQGSRVFITNYQGPNIYIGPSARTMRWPSLKEIQVTFLFSFLALLLFIFEKFRFPCHALSTDHLNGVMLWWWWWCSSWPANGLLLLLRRLLTTQWSTITISSQWWWWCAWRVIESQEKLNAMVRTFAEWKVIHYCCVHDTISKIHPKVVRKLDIYSDTMEWGCGSFILIFDF